MKVMVYLKPMLEEYEVRLYLYNEEGKLIDVKSYTRVKQIVVRAEEVRVSRQIFHEQLAMIIESSSPRVEYRDGGVLYIEEST